MAVALKGRVAVVMGATSSRGAAIVRRLSDEGVKVVMGDESIAEMRAVTREWKRDRIAYCEYLGDPKGDFERCVQKAVQIFGEVHFVVSAKDGQVTHHSVTRAA